VTVDFQRSAASPVAERGKSGIWIASSTEIAHGAFRRLAIHGTFLVTDAEAEAIGVLPLHGAVVVTVTSGLVHNAFPMLGDTLAFDDDEQAERGLVQGHFNLDLLARLRTAPYQRFYVTASLGRFLSNTLTLGG
jgi:hypothetical protein